MTIKTKDGVRISEDPELRKILDFLTAKESGFPLVIKEYEDAAGEKYMSVHGPIDDVMALVFSAFKSLFDKGESK